MWTIFALENLFFALNVFTALVFFSVAWLYSDAYKTLKNKRDILKIVGFTIIGASFLIRGLDLRGIALFQSVDIYLRTFGYLTLFIGLLVDPLQDEPRLQSIAFFVFPPLLFASPIIASIIAVLYLRRASIGLERHLYPPAISFFLLSLYEITFSLNLFGNTSNLKQFNLLAPFGTVWLLNLAFLFLAVLFLSRWVFRYLLKQFQSQLFMILMSLVLIIYLIVTVGFTGLLINNLKDQILQEISSQSKVLEFAMNSKKAELLSDAKLIAKSEIGTISHDSIIFFNTDGVVTYRAEDTERKGDSISQDILVKRILSGKEASNIVVTEGVIAPTVMLVSGTPIIKDGKVDGGVMVYDLIDDAYLEGFSKLTGLKAAAYGGDILSSGGTIGIKETNSKVKDNVLIKNQTYALESKWLNRSYLSVYTPLKDVEGNPVGMFFVGRPQSDVIDLASKTLESVFLGTIILLLLSMIPAKIIATSISKQIK